MRRTFLLILSILLLALLCGCSLDFSQQADDGAFSYAYGDKEAFVNEYRWDGSEEGLTIYIPDSFNGLPVVSVGGFFGRGLPMPFSIDCSAFFPDNVQFAEESEIESIDETTEFSFTLIIPDKISSDELKIGAAEWSQYVIEKDGKVIEYRFGIDIEQGK